MKMDDFKSYLSRLRKGLSKVSPSEQDDIIEEIQSHIEDGLQDPKMGESQKDRVKNTMSKLGNTKEITYGMNEVHRRYNWLDVILIMAIFPALFAIAILMRYSRIHELQVLVNLFMFLGMITIARRLGSTISEGWYLSWANICTLVILYNSIKWIYKKRFLMRSRPNFITYEAISAWLMISLLSIFLIIALGFLIRRIWLSRRDGLYIFFLIFPITFQTSISIGEFITEATHPAITANTSSPFWVGFFGMIMIAILSIAFACTLMMPKVFKRWYFLVIGMMALMINNAIAYSILHHNTRLIVLIEQFTIQLSGLFIPVIIGLAIEYAHTGRNPLLPIRS